MIRISTTAVEQYRKLMQTSYVSEADLIGMVKNEPFRESWQMRAGTEFERLVTAPVPPPDDADHRYQIPNVNAWFGFDDVAHVSSQIDHRGTFQGKLAVPMDIHGREVVVVAKADHILGTQIEEYKCRFGAANPNDWDASLQWRLYLHLLGGSEVAYTVWKFSHNPHDDGQLKLLDILRFSYLPYPEIEADCVRWVGEFLCWVEYRGLLSFLDRNGT